MPSNRVGDVAVEPFHEWFKLVFKPAKVSPEGAAISRWMLGLVGLSHVDPGWFVKGFEAIRLVLDLVR